MPIHLGNNLPTCKDGGIMAEPVTLQFSAPKRGMPPTHFADLTPEERTARITDLGLPKFRADQIARHYYGRFEADPSTMTDLPVAARETITKELFPTLLSPVRFIEPDDGDTTKSLWRLNDGTLLESVLIRYPPRPPL